MARRAVRLRYLLDTNILIYLAKRQPDSVAARFARLRPREVAMSCVTYGELRYGAEKSSKREQAIATLERLAERIVVLPLDASASVHYGRIRKALEEAGTPLGNNDTWIAAHALAANLILVTNNEREFARVAGLKRENWVSSPGRN
jgi:tRNA(fMet)-specific endonuclease VapC